MRALEQVTRTKGFYSANKNLNGIGSNVDGWGRFMVAVAAPDPAYPFVADIATDNSKPVIGVLLNRPVKGEGCTIAFADVLRVRSGAAVTNGQNVTIDNAGRAIPQSGAALSYGVARSSCTGPDMEIMIETDLSRGQFP